MLSSFVAVCFLITVKDVKSVFQKDSGCGVTKGCFSDCQTGCTYLIGWTKRNSVVTFTIQTELASNADQYAAVGLSATESMDATSVSACIMTNSGGTFNVSNSYNTGYSNSPVANPNEDISSVTGSYQNSVLTCNFDRSLTNTDPKVYDLNQKYYVLYAKGNGAVTQHSSSNRAVSRVKVDLSDNIDLGASDDELMRIKAHGGLAVMAWMCLINIGYVVARYYKPLWSSRIVLGGNIWFLIHRVLMVLGAILTITSFGVIIQGNFNVGENSFEKSHPYLGVIIFCLVIINPIVGISRPDKTSRYRPIFYWFHYCIGIGALILALINIFIGIRLGKSATSDKAYYIFIVYEIFQISLIIVLEVFRYIGKKNTENANISVEMDTVGGDDSKSTSDMIEQTPYAWNTKLILLCVHVIVTVVLSSVITGIVATSTSSSD